MNKHEVLKFIESLYWDIQIEVDTIYNFLIEEYGLDSQIKRKFYLRLLKGADCYTIISLLNTPQLKEALSDYYINVLFPRDLRDRYLFARRLLFKLTLPTSGFRSFPTGKNQLTFLPHWWNCTQS